MIHLSAPRRNFGHDVDFGVEFFQKSGTTIIPTMAQAGRDQPKAKRREGTPPTQPQRRSIATIVLLLIAGLLIADGIAGERGWLANRRAEAQLQAAQRALEQEKARNDRLREDGRRLREMDPRAIEDVARRQLGLIKPGEKVFIVRDQVKEPGK
jgi:cell division protein FtsB